jgi:hypothetical protein
MLVHDKGLEAAGKGRVPLGRLDRSMSRTMSMVCSICRTHSPSGGQMGRISMAMLCHDESNNL